MSIIESTTEAANSGPTAKPSTHSSHDTEELAALDLICDRIRKCVPPAPYILSVPTDRPYQHWSQQESQGWMLGHLFQPNEEHLQYRTFKYRDPIGTSFAIRSGEDEYIDRSEKRSKAKGWDTPTQGPKKKISLSAYKAKQANGLVGTPISNKPSPELGPVEADRTQTNGANDAPKYSSQTSEPTQQPGQKRPLDESVDSLQPSKSAQERQPPAKKKRPSPLPDANPSLEATALSDGTPHGLPPLLSPTTLPNPYGLPPILSPTLPSNIQCELDRLETQRKRGDSNASSSSDPKSQLLSVPDLKKQKSDETLKNTANIISKKGELKTRPGPFDAKTSAGTQVQTSHAPREPPKAAASGREQTLIVKLKYSKKNRKEIERYLRLPPRNIAVEKKERLENLKERVAQGKQKQVELSAGKSKEAAKGTSQNAIASTPSNHPETKMRTVEKRGRQTDDVHSVAPPSKRQKAPAMLEVDKRPATPASQAMPSPALSNQSSAQKSQVQYVTPLKELRALNMIRTGSAEGNDATPGRSGATPSGSKLPDSKSGPTSAPPVNGKHNADIQAWSNASQNLNKLGRSLKHESQKLVENWRDSSKKDRLRAAVMSIECIICYIASFSASDLCQRSKGRPAEVENTWKTLMPLLLSLRPRMREFPHLDGLRLYLAVVISSRISGLLAQRRQPNAQHGSPQNEVSVDFALLAEQFMYLQRYSREARMTLPLADIEEQYPETWKGRECVADPAMDWENLPAGKLKGPYFLPIGPDTTPVQAVRFGVQFLKEWLAKEGLEYELQVSLE
ncbi:hypothetical protein K432DRAFT_404772 [Lepidopterella palustris CBS 459.81]|uniref:Uncharacterized protein n=1 Tax=Lepidopterella palustris CBS 459.81 TaxID=1314670 RepID=A0A8E2EAP4_9PEZI|nr:hypothetical protein K432DRAFT_404772 [Lepidopterella palustris CBS 459.81]